MWLSLLGSYVVQNHSKLLMYPVADGNLAQVFEGSLPFPLPGITDPFMLRRSLSCLASATAHLHSIIGWHCDIKPSNILIRDGGFLLTDLALRLVYRPKYMDP